MFFVGFHSCDFSECLDEEFFVAAVVAESLGHGDAVEACFSVEEGFGVKSAVELVAAGVAVDLSFVEIESEPGRVGRVGSDGGAVEVHDVPFAAERVGGARGGTRGEKTQRKKGEEDGFHWKGMVV